MTLVRWQPRRFVDFRNGIDRIFEELWDGPSAPSAWRPAMDVSETENEIVVHADLPGLSKDQVKVNLENNLLTVRGEKQHVSDREDTRHHRSERSYGTFTRALRLPSDVETGKISASYKDGVLTLTLPKSEAAKPKEIEVKVA